MKQFWVPSYPFLDPSLIVVPGSTAPSITKLSFYDCDGELCNQANLIHENSVVQSIELDPLIVGCKIESGFRHANMIVENEDPQTNCFLRLAGSVRAFTSLPVTMIAQGSSGFFPFALNDGQSHILALLNSSSNSSQVKCRLYIGNRNPEETIEIPAYGTKVVHIESTFQEVCLPVLGTGTQGYIRITSRTQAQCGVQLLVKQTTADELNRPIFLSI